jgi:3-methyladenine DNA glycosylase AlkD
MKNGTEEITNKLKELGDPDIAAHSQRFFKTGKGEYGEGDIFLGIRVPVLRKCAKEYRNIPLRTSLDLLKSPFHEARLLALLILVLKYAKGAPKEQESIYHSYLKNTRFINNWDLVDTSAEHIVGAHLFEKDRKPLYELAVSQDIWERRIAVLSTFHYIKRGDFSDSLAIIELLVNDGEDLIHKATGWMLREVGKRDLEVEEAFLMRHYKKMPRTMLRYAIEKFPETERRAYLLGER